MSFSIIVLAFVLDIKAYYGTTLTLDYVYDGDTVKATLVTLPDQLKQISLRINGIDTPEVRTSCINEKEKGYDARDFLALKISQAEKIEVNLIKWGKFGGRIIADIILDGRQVRDIMIESGHAVAYDGGRKTHNWCDRPRIHRSKE